jgi:hypothetical protein
LTTQLKITGEGARFLDRLAKNPGGKRDEIRDFVFEVLKPLGPKAAGHVIKTQLSGRPAPAYKPTSGRGSKQRKERRTGQLARSIVGRAIKFEGLPALEVGQLRAGGTRVARYGWTQEYGTKGLNPESPVQDIKPRNKKFLAVPQEPALTPTGVPRYDSPRDYPGDLVVIKFQGLVGKNKNVAGKLVSKKAYDDARAAAALGQPSSVSLDAVYLLLTFVRIRPGHFLRDGVQDYLPILSAKLGDALFKRYIARGGRK